MLVELDKLEENSIDCIITDPPYELGFMGKNWDSAGISFQKLTWEKCFRVLKPGGYLLAFGGSRTYHRIACAIEDAGFEIRDTIMWIYGSGFPKSMNIGLAIDKCFGYTGNRSIGFSFAGDDGRKAPLNRNRNLRADYGGKYDVISDLAKKWEGFGTALKPAFEPIIMARKPVEHTVVENLLKYGVGGINIDECRVETDEEITTHSKSAESSISKGIYGDYGSVKTHQTKGQKLGRFPANLILTYDDSDYDEVCGGFPKTNDESACRYFYCAKTTKRDRDEGLNNFETRQSTGGGGGIGDYLNDVNSASGKFGSEKAPHKNHHPTVKPTALMQYLVRLVAPKGSVILDPFMGSGSTGKAIAYENNDRGAGYSFIGIEMQEDYFEIAKARISFAETDNTQPEQIIAKDHESVDDSEDTLF